ncbi:MAG: Gfo/Idh/MocA family protein [Acetivibrionales bacterium]|jgi:predicted dehydrogenase
MKTVKVGLVGCGVISDIYLQNAQKFDIMDIVACADIIPEKAEAKAKEYNIKACSVDELMNDPEIEIVLNLTIPQAHAEVSLAALNAGKHTYAEKPLAVTREDGQKILKLAKSKGLLVGCAPDTFLGGRLQTCRKIIDDGWIGEPIGATAFMACHGHECWHPGPEFYYKIGAGPMFDMGPYYMTALVSLLGPVNRVSGSARMSFKQRIITSEPLNGKVVDVEVPTHITGALEFKSGPIATVLTSFDVWDAHLPRVEIYGSEGTLSIADIDPLAGPNLFEGEILIKRKDDADWNGFPTQLPRKFERTEWNKIPTMFGYNANSRGVGLADMAYAVRSGRAHRANGDMAYHVLEIMHGIHDAANSGKYYELKSTCERPEPLPMGLAEYKLDE